MKNYKVILDGQRLTDFVNWLPDLNPSEIFFVALFARKKYSNSKHPLRRDGVLRRFTSDKENLFTKLRQLECPEGSYLVGDEEVPQQCLAAYISVNPRCRIKATKAGMIQFANLLSCDYSGHNPHQNILSQIQKSKSRTCYVDFDFDGRTQDHIKESIFSAVPPNAVTFLSTRGGCHVLVDPKKCGDNRWYKKIANISGCDSVGDNLIPIPGCTQGEFIPELCTNFAAG